MHIGRTFSIILTGCLRVLGGVFDDRMRILTGDERQRQRQGSRGKNYI